MANTKPTINVLHFAGVAGKTTSDTPGRRYLCEITQSDGSVIREDLLEAEIETRERDRQMVVIWAPGVKSEQHPISDDAARIFKNHRSP